MRFSTELPTNQEMPKTKIYLDFFGIRLHSWTEELVAQRFTPKDVYAYIIYKGSIEATCREVREIERRTA